MTSLILCVVLFLIMVVGNSFSLNYENDHNQCALRNAECNVGIARPCCDSNDHCKNSRADNSFRCIRQMQLGKFCERDADCDEIRHSKCSKENTCICRTNNVELNKTTCAPVLGGFCWKNEICATFNAVCINNECQCKDKYFPRGNTQCIFNMLDAFCENDEICEQVRFAKCSKHKICSCSSSTFRVNSTHCAPVVGGFCWTTDDCLPSNSVCVANRCKCKEFDPFQSRPKCIPVHLNETCTSNDDCSRINHAKCSTDYVCVCGHNYVAINEVTCRPSLGGNCRKNEDCMARNSICIDYICRCKPNFLRLSGNACVMSQLGVYCRNDNDCNAILRGECSEYKKCSCKYNYAEYNNTSCAPLIGGYCSEDKLCAPVNSSCTNNVCLCDKGFFAKSSRSCLRYHLGMRCQLDETCETLLYSHCSNGQCVCKGGYAMVNETSCAPGLGEYCRKNQQCAPLNSQCIDNLCLCKTDYLIQSDTKCVAKYLGLSCKENDDCNQIKFAICSADKKCVCNFNYVALGIGKCIALIGEYCDQDEECISYNTVCISNTCQCPARHAPKSKQKCEHVSIGVTCQNDYDCKSSMKNSVCSNDAVCVCRRNFYALNDSECVPSLSEYCLNNDECRFNSSICIDHKCQCQENFKSVSRNQCIALISAYRCNRDSDCGDPWHNKCSADKICVCNLNNISINKSTCSPLLNGYCWTDRQCVVPNSFCFDYRCRCNNNFVPISDNLCLPHN